MFFVEKVSRGEVGGFFAFQRTKKEHVRVFFVWAVLQKLCGRRCGGRDTCLPSPKRKKKEHVRLFSEAPKPHKFGARCVVVVVKVWYY